MREWSIGLQQKIYTYTSSWIFQLILDKGAEVQLEGGTYSQDTTCKYASQIRYKLLYIFLCMHGFGPPISIMKYLETLTTCHMYLNNNVLKWWVMCIDTIRPLPYMYLGIWLAKILL